VVGVVFADGRVGEFDPGGEKYRVGDLVVVDNARDLNLGRVVYVADRVHEGELRPVKRRISPSDWMLIRRNQIREAEAFDLCQKLIEELGLPMKLIRVAYLHGGNKAIFFFSAEGRVDFRELVRRLARQLHVRIEMRQIGVRDESKMLGGIGICGQMLCCCRFLNKFVPVSIKMAKNQNLSLNPQKLSGVCGRLMCCLVYEDEQYTENRKVLPKVGQVLDTPAGQGAVVELDVPRKLVKVQVGDAFHQFSMEQLERHVRGEPEKEPEQAAKEQAGEGKEDAEGKGEIKSAEATRRKRKRRGRKRKRKKKTQASGGGQGK
ncbi:MAG: stage 0 sporulation protein, partial [Deltaproteobacteria bacterium]